MSGALVGICQIVCLASRAYTLTLDAAEVPQIENGKGERITAIIAKALSLAGTTYIEYKELSATTTDAIEDLEQTDAIGRVVAFCFSMPDMIRSNLRGQQGTAELIDQVAAGVIAPILKICALIDKQSLRHLLTIPYDDRKIEWTDNEGDDHIWHPTDEELLGQLANNEAVFNIGRVIQGACDLELVNTAVNRSQRRELQNLDPQRAFRALINQIRQGIPQVHPLPLNTGAPLVGNPAEAVVVDPFAGDFLLQLSTIPACMHQDPAFRHCCPITRLPIRNPVLLNNIHYERSAIMNWVINKRCDFRNPNEPATIGDIQEDRLLQQMIDHRLRKYQDGVKEMIRQEIPTIPAGYRV